MYMHACLCVCVCMCACVGMLYAFVVVLLFFGVFFTVCVLMIVCMYRY